MTGGQQGLLSEGTTVVQFDGRDGRLFSTDLLNVLIMPDGHFFAGLVTPSVLEAAASSAAPEPPAPLAEMSGDAAGPAAPRRWP